MALFLEQRLCEREIKEDNMPPLLLLIVFVISGNKLATLPFSS
tara:strand:- start:154 stop:282 length:129 start_codon:yes stop_codon:yes gene_type:complete